MSLYTRTRGFTLTEMMITVVIVGVLLAIAVPSFRQMILLQSVKTASFDLFSALEFARSEAIKRSNVVSVKPDSTWSTGWKVVDSTDVPLRRWSASSAVSLSTTPSGLSAITFTKDGHLTTAAPQLQIDPTTTMNGVDSRCISVDLIGRPRTKVGACS